MATIYVEGQPYQVRDGQNLLQACLEMGFNLPYFCWHPAMGSVGACRQCAVKQFRDENDTRGRIVMACMTPATQGTRISIIDPEAVAFRASVTEWMMMSHPHDCPICDEGGECHLQDMTVMTGHNYRKYQGQKRTFNNQNLGPLINHEMNRCIQCYRCVRFYREYAGGKDFDAFLNRDQVFFGRHADGVLENEFSGNLVEVCPTGVFTDKTLKRHYTRKWDEQSAPSICVHCSLGCNTIASERYGLLRRIRNRYNGEVNGYFLCDRGRFGYEFVNDKNRLRQPRLNSRTDPLSREEAFTNLTNMLADRTRVIGIGSPRASLESNFALRSLVGPDHFFQGVQEKQTQIEARIVDILQRGPARSASLQDVEQCDAVLVLGEDVTNTAPMLALALRQSVRQKPLKMVDKARIPRWDDHSSRVLLQDERGPLYIGSLTATRLDDVATATFHGGPDDLARLGFAVAHLLDPSAPEPEDLPDEISNLAKEVAQALLQADHPLVVSGTSVGSQALIEAAANVAWALCKSGLPGQLSFVLPEVNSFGSALMGGELLDAAIQAIVQDKADTVIILENELFSHKEASSIEMLLDKARQIIVIDHLENQTTKKGHLVLPAATFAESHGTFVNNEGRAQRYYSVFIPEGEIQPGWCWLDISNEWHSEDEVLSGLVDSIPVFKPALEIAPPANYRLGGMKISRESPRYSGRTAMYANQNVSEAKPPQDPESPLSFTMEGSPLQPPPALIPRFWAPGWNSIQSLNKFQAEVGGPLRGGDPGKRLIEPDSRIQQPILPHSS